MKDPHKYDTLYQEICSDNVQRMSELIAIIETKNLIQYWGYPMLKLHKSLCNDIDFKTDINRLFSDNYDIVQNVAVLLCEHYGKRLTDTCYIDKHGKKVTVRILCNREIYKFASRQLSRNKPTSLEALPKYIEPKTEMTEFNNDYTETDRIIESFELNETFTVALECRMSGMSYPEIGRIVGRSQSTVWQYCRLIQQKYTAVYGAI